MSGGEVYSTQSTSANADLIHTTECVAYEQTQASVRRQEKLYTRSHRDNTKIS